MLKPFATLFAVAIASSGAQAEEQASPEVAVVVRMYRDFAWEVLIAEPISREPTFVEQPKKVLDKYLDAELVRLLIADRACVAKRREICNLDFDPIWASQDPAATDLKVVVGKRVGTVDVSFIYPSNATPMRLRYEMIQTPAGPRIRDIHYAEGPSLLAILRRKQ